MALIECPECTGRVSSRALACPHCGFPVRAELGEGGPEQTLLEISPRLFGGNWLTHFGVALLCLVLVGIVLYVVEYLKSRSTRLKVTSRRTVLESGILSKQTNEVRHSDIRNIQVRQGVFDRLFGVGELELSSAGQSDVEIDVRGIPNPQEVADLIRKHR
jgi:membrane protein YdbS with pleckstrin-like domain